MINVKNPFNTQGLTDAGKDQKINWPLNSSGATRQLYFQFLTGRALIKEFIKSVYQP